MFNDEQRAMASRHLRLAYKLAAKYAPGDADAVSAATDALLSAVASYVPGMARSEASWVYMHVRFGLLRYRRSSLRRQARFVASTFNYTAAKAVNLDAAIDVGAMLRTLHPRYRNILCLYYLQNYSLRDIANMEGVSHQCISGVLRRGVAKLRERFSGYYGHSDGVYD